MPAPTPQSIDHRHWLSRWDSQQAGYVPEREERFRVMFDAVEALLPPAFVALDLACGPGSLSERLLARFPQAHSIAVDMDPVMLALGQGALGTAGGRLRWVDGDIASPPWLENLAEPQVDVVLSTTALHWLDSSQLVRLYQELGRLVRPGGLFLNGDNLPFGPRLPTFQQLSSDRLEKEWSDDAFAARGVETAEQWWAALALEPSMAPLLSERERRLAPKKRPESPTILDLHIAALYNAGFREAGTLWQSGTNRVVLAVR